MLLMSVLSDTIAASKTTARRVRHDEQIRLSSDNAGVKFARAHETCPGSSFTCHLTATDGQGCLVRSNTKNRPIDQKTGTAAPRDRSQHGGFQKDGSTT